MVFPEVTGDRKVRVALIYYFKIRPRIEPGAVASFGREPSSPLGSTLLQFTTLHLSTIPISVIVVRYRFTTKKDALFLIGVTNHLCGVS